MEIAQSGRLLALVGYSKEDLMENFKNKRLFEVLRKNTLEIVTIAIVFFSLLGTQILLPLELNGRTIYPFFAEFFLILLFGITAVWLLVKRKKLIINKTELILLSGFVIWFIVLTGYRFIYVGDVSGAFLVFRTLMFPVLLALFFRQIGAPKKHMAYGVVLFATCMNIYQIYNLVFVTQNFRTVTSLKNINIYLCFMLALIPVFVFLLKNLDCCCRTWRVVLKGVLLFNILSISIFTIFSGSRLALLMLPISLFGSYFAINGFSKKAFVKFLAILLSLILLASAFIILNLYESKSSIERTLTPVLEIIQKYMPSIQCGGNDDIGTGENIKNENVADSNTMRDLLWQKSIESIKKSPFWGTSTTDVEIEMYFSGDPKPVIMVQSPHNFIIESWMALGLLGMCIYFAMLILLAVSVLRKKMKKSLKINFLICMFIIFGFSFFQPLVTYHLVISIILWLVIYLCTQNPTQEVARQQ